MGPRLSSQSVLLVDDNGLLAIRKLLLQTSRRRYPCRLRAPTTASVCCCEAVALLHHPAPLLLAVGWWRAHQDLYRARSNQSYFPNTSPKVPGPQQYEL
ncbi:hypothetical protein ACH5RR_033864 [Cinchona calisaya]|uniref:Uncharacterized protein n=1 Tax=Cinchona calisaya TaxID=153742 RepID=A0ABD2YAJ3_9GENT